MLVHPASSRLHAQTSVIPDPGNLIDFMAPDSVAMLRNGDGVVGIGEITRYIADSPDAADVWWQEFSATVEQESELPGVRGTGVLAFGSFAFDPDNTVEPSVLVVPEVIVGRRDGLCWLTRVGYNRATSVMPDRQEPARPPTGLRIVTDRRADETFRRAVEELIPLMADDRLNSVVLARRLTARAEEPIDPRWIARRLARRDPDAWLYAVDGMIGSSRDLLITTNQRFVVSRVIAGSTTAPSDPLADEPTRESAETLFRLFRLSNRHKHEIARSTVEQTLADFCETVHASPGPYAMQTPDTWHLATDVTGVLAEGTSSLGVAAALHPTAAAAGSPTRAALDLINELESMDRGHFSGPVGWIDAQGDGEWVLAVRGGQVNPATPHRIEMFAGSGIVQESDADWEYGMTVGKFQTMLDALGLTP